MNFLSNQWLIAIGFNFLLILLVHKLPLLTKQGWFHAGILGSILLGAFGWNGWLSVVIYLVLGSLVTRLGFKKKKLSGLAEGRDGRRGPENVWGSAGTGAILAILFELNIANPDIILLAFAASFTAKLADTFGSEIGKRWGRKTVLITSFKPVEAGTDGGITIEGTLASLLGSICMVFFMILLDFVPFNLIALLVISIGFISTLMESYLGAIFQNKISFLSNEIINFIQTSFAALLIFIILGNSSITF